MCSVHRVRWVRCTLLWMMYLLGGRNSGGSGSGSGSGRCGVASPWVVVRKLNIIKRIFLKA